MVDEPRRARVIVVVNLLIGTREAGIFMISSVGGRRKTRPAVRVVHLLLATARSIRGREGQTLADRTIMLEARGRRLVVVARAKWPIRWATHFTIAVDVKGHVRANVWATILRPGREGREEEVDLVLWSVIAFRRGKNEVDGIDFMEGAPAWVNCMSRVLSRGGRRRPVDDFVVVKDLCIGIIFISAWIET